MGDNEQMGEELVPETSQEEVLTTEEAGDSQAGSEDVGALQRDLEDARRRAEFYEQMYLRQQQAQPPVREEVEDDVSYDPVDLASFKDVDSLVEKRLQQRLKPLEQQFHDTAISQAEMALRVKHPDYDEVLNTYTKRIFQEDPELAQLVYRSKNAPILAYRLGLSHPDYQRQVKSKTTQDVASTIQRNQGIPKPTGKAGGATGAPASSVWDVPRDKFNEMVKKAKAGVDVRL